MTLSPTTAVHSFALMAFLALGPGGCDDHDSLNNVVDTPIETPGTPATPPPPGPGPGPGPQGGTPEPGTLLLLAGGAAGYAALRRRKTNGLDTDGQTEG